MTNLPGDIDSAHHYFKPVYRHDNRLMGMEIMTFLVGMYSADGLYSVDQAANLDVNQQISLFNEKILLLEKVSALLESWQITIWLNINDIILAEMMQNTDWVARLQKLSLLMLMLMLMLMIDEDFPGIIYGRNNLRLILAGGKIPPFSG